LRILSFDEKSTFDYFASNGKIKRACCSGNCQTLNYQTRARARRARTIHREMLGNIQKLRARAARYAFIFS
jgi:hypothetical protein